MYSCTNKRTSSQWTPNGTHIYELQQRNVPLMNRHSSWPFNTSKRLHGHLSKLPFCKPLYTDNNILVMRHDV